ncbi:zinc-binding metallopeptidase family protein [Naasia aerilata]|uniref:Zinc-ribbon domain-containing protein n=1 Tax=Naasia aerilata TaxID=1162966 RepID=A0ABN6XR14_9MICO|nr:putative zinc-binding metallopeptidase [Naasia aerilata]BDZ47429.1 hypothetical protein GCM10025866_33380 [Naasia aerilata]
MRVFACPKCGAWVEFEDRMCLACSTSLAYSPDRDDIVLADAEVLCGFREQIGCNWVADPEGDGECASDRLTVERPGEGDPVAIVQLAVAEQAKRRLVRQLRHLGLPIEVRAGDHGLGFALKSPADGEQVLTGHADGLITINLTEASDPHREEVRIQLGEPYRTMLGHLRHEIGHYYWLVLVDEQPEVEPFRQLFGDERQDYGDALTAHYGNGDAGDWATDHISQYATMHPWEDFAETFAHYLHIADVLETTASVGVTVDGPTGVPAPLAGSISSRGAADISGLTMPEVLTRWHGFSLAVNAINRSMGEPDLYPFVLTPAIGEKLAQVHDLVRGV